MTGEDGMMTTVINPWDISAKDIVQGIQINLTIAQNQQMGREGAQTFLQSAPPCARLLGFPDLVPSVTVVLLSKVMTL